MKQDLIIKLLKMLAHYEATDMILWTEDLEFYIPCSDFLAHATADAESIETEEDLNLLEKCFQDTDGVWGGLLYCARKANQQPLEEWFEDHIPKRFHKIFRINSGK